MGKISKQAQCGLTSVISWEPMISALFDLKHYELQAKKQYVSNDIYFIYHLLKKKKSNSYSSTKFHEFFFQGKYKHS